MRGPFSFLGRPAKNLFHKRGQDGTDAVKLYGPAPQQTGRLHTKIDDGRSDPFWARATINVQVRL